MLRRTLLLIATLALVPALWLLPPALSAQSATSRLPVRQSGQELYTLMTQLSEPDGFFRSDNLVSNELYMQKVVPDLARLVRPGRVYLGVGPEQNFTYMAATKPSMAFIVDVRRGNLRLHLMYKAIFELAADRADFVSRLFSLKRPAGLTRKSSVQEIVAAYSDPMLRSAELYKQNAAAMRQVYIRKNGLGLAAEDLQGIEEIYQTFFKRGLDIRYEITPGSGGSFPTYAELLVASDGASIPRGFLATEENFAVIKDLHGRNLVVPVVGNFAGPKAIRAIGKYLKSRNALVGAFYVSNVEQYLNRDGLLDEFCASAASLPIDESSAFIRSERGFGSGGGRASARGGFGGNFSSQVINMLSEVRACTR
jgi:hypothetical protein